MVSRPATCHNVIAGRRRTRFLNVLKTGFPAAPATLHGHAINCVPVHRFRMGRTPETGLTLAEWREFSRYALACILMHAVKTEPARFWRVFGWFVACFTGFLSETPPAGFSGAYNHAFMLNDRCKKAPKGPEGFPAKGRNGPPPGDLFGSSLCDHLIWSVQPSCGHGY